MWLNKQVTIYIFADWNCTFASESVYGRCRGSFVNNCKIQNFSSDPCEISPFSSLLRAPNGICKGVWCYDSWQKALTNPLRILSNYVQNNFRSQRKATNIFPWVVVLWQRLFWISCQDWGTSVYRYLNWTLLVHTIQIFFLICTKLSSFLSHIEGIDIRMSHIEERFDHELALLIGCCIQMPGIV